MNRKIQFENNNHWKTIKKINNSDEKDIINWTVGNNYHKSHFKRRE